MVIRPLLARCGSRRAMAAALLIWSLLIFAVSAQAACGDLLPDSRYTPAPPRQITADDLLRLRDIGQPDSSLMGQPTPLALSPDGKQVAFVLTRADPDTNSYCRGLVVVGLDGSVPPRLIDRGGDLIIADTVARGLVVSVGIAAPVTPQWSPDGRWIAWLRRDGQRTRLWRVRAAGGDAGPVGPDRVDIDSFAWLPNGNGWIVARRLGAADHAKKVEASGLAGWLYDTQIVPSMGPHPLMPGDLPATYDVVDARDRSVRPASADETALLQSETGKALDVRSAGGRRAWTERTGENPASPLRLLVQDAQGRAVECRADTCGGGFLGLWWNASGRELRFLRREGWAHEDMALYRWTPGDGRPHLIWRGRDVLIGCINRDETLLCLREDSTTPRRLSRMDLATGQWRDVFNPNPEFKGIALGNVERLHWRNDRGLEAWGDLVMPPGFHSAKKLPLVIVQYHSDGFLRGGTGDEYPIYLFAAKGFAVLSVEDTASVAKSIPGVKTWDQFNAANAKDWVERRSLLSSLMTGVDMVLTRGDVDPHRIGITGLSDGASTVRFAMINAPIFAAASISSCCLEPRTVMTLVGTVFADKERAMGAPRTTSDDFSYWLPFSVALNARRVNAPLLMQLADEESVLGLETFTALREESKPVEMYIFPDEHHIKWQPAHRRAIYVRNLDWFSFWLKGQEDPDPTKQQQYHRWRSLRDQQVAVAPR